MIPLQSVSRPQATVRASALAGLIVLGFGLSVCTESDGAKTDLHSHLISHVYEIERDQVRFEAIYRPGGVLDLRSSLGRFEGEWALEGEALCVAFDSKPALGMHCSPVAADKDGALQLAKGLTMRPVARVHHFDN